MHFLSKIVVRFIVRRSTFCPKRTIKIAIFEAFLYLHLPTLLDR